MKEEKQLTEYKEPKGILNWLKSKFGKLKEIFSSKKDLESKQDWSNYELTEEELENVKGGIPMPTHVVDEEELMADLGIKKPQLGELTEEELNEIKGGQPIIDDER